MKGYKIFYKEYKQSSYEDKNYSLFTMPTTEKHYFEVGKTYSLDCKDYEIKAIENGIHFCKEIKLLFRYYPFSDRYTAVCEIEASDTIDEKKNICACKTIRIVRELSFEELKEYFEQNANAEFSEEAQSWEYNFNCKNISNVNYSIESILASNSDYLSQSSNIKDSLFITMSRNVIDSQDIWNCNNIYQSRRIIASNNISNCQSIKNSENCRNSYEVINSENVSFSSQVEKGIMIMRADGVAFSKNVIYSRGIMGSNQIVQCFAVQNCQNLYFSLFCYGIKNKQNCFFNKKLEEREITEIRKEFFKILDGWHPHFVSPQYILDSISYKRAWGMLKTEAIEYLYNSKYFDKEIFYKITEIDITKYKFYEGGENENERETN